MSLQNSQSQAKPTVFILCLDKEEEWEGLFDQSYADLIESLASKYRIQRARKADAALRYLSNSDNRPVAILIVDPGLSKATHVSVLNHVKEYVRGGGIAVFMANFSSFIRPAKLNNFWKKQWGLDWQMGDYHRTVVYLNRNTPSLSPASLPHSYSQKAVFLNNVAPRDSLYLPSPESRTQSRVFPATPINQEQTPVVFTTFGHGWLGYLGDVNNEQGSQKVVMEICRFGTYIAGSE